MRARSALFDVYGDHLRTRGDQAPVSALIRLLEPVGIAEPAVRTAISRMAAQGWLEPTRVDDAPGYRATHRATERLSEAAARIYRSAPEPWDGRWRIVFLDPPRHRGVRDRLRQELTYLGHAEHAPGVWLCPFPRPEVGGGLYAPEARPGTPSPSSSIPTRSAPGTCRVSPRRTPRGRPWPSSSRATSRLPAMVAMEAGEAGAPVGDADERAFAARFRLVHEWRKFLFEDPGLPAELLPTDWPGLAAAELFTREATRLKPAADRFVGRCLGGA